MARCISISTARWRSRSCRPVPAESFASAISIGSGFRGGLFFASLFMGALLGKLFAYSAPYFAHATLTPIIYAVVGMSSLAVAVIGGPLTMTFLALEITGDFPITALVLAASSPRRWWCAAPSATPSPPGASTCAAKASAAPTMSAGSAI
jgi:hypothetical protein